MNPPAVCLLDDLGVLRIAGPDARKFLQGQLSNDVAALAPGCSLRAGLHNPQGRTLALLQLAAQSEQVLLAVLPQELLAITAATLQRYVLRAKVTISDAGDTYGIYGLAQGSPAEMLESAPSRTGSADPACPDVPSGGLQVDHGGGRQLLIAPRAAPAPPGPALTRAAWRLLDIAAGLPQLHTPTSGQFVAQMLNLDCIGAISFTKGCYTGQEVIARAHYRGRVKRRMQRFESDAPVRLAPGDSAQLADGRSLRLVEVETRADGHVEFLAVAPLPGAAATDADRDTAVGAGPEPLAASPLPLPYALS